MLIHEVILDGALITREKCFSFNEKPNYCWKVGEVMGTDTVFGKTYLIGDCYVRFIGFQ